MIKKNVYRLLSIVFICCIVFQGLFYFSFLRSQSAKQGEKQETTAEQSAYPVQHATETILKPGASYTCISYFTKEQTTSRQEGTIASAFVGWTREEFEEYLKGYMTQERQEQKELLSVELLQFSANGITIKKTYRSEQQWKYLLVVEKNQIVVYDAKWENKYEETGIDVRTLCEEERDKLNEGIYVADEGELYGILEDYSS